MEGPEEELHRLVERRRHEGSPVMLAKYLLSELPKDQKKIEERRKVLEANPEERISVDTLVLKRIIPYLSLKCHPECSVAQDRAIKGSDIDGALVLLSERIVTKKQQQFVAELRNQGFDVYHPSDLDAAQRAYYRAQNGEARQEASAKISAMMGKTVEFRTEEQMKKQLEKEVFDITLNVHLAGAEVA